MKRKISNILAKFSQVMAAAGVAQEGDFNTARELLSEVEGKVQQYPRQKVGKPNPVMRPLRNSIGAMRILPRDGAQDISEVIIL